MNLTTDNDPRVEVTMIFADCEYPMAAAVEWARSIVTSRGIDPSKDQVVFILQHRRTEPSLSLKSSVYLAQMTAGVSRTERNTNGTCIKSLPDTNCNISRARPVSFKRTGHIGMLRSHLID